jgi:hypothetical protein
VRCAEARSMPEAASCMPRGRCVASRLDRDEHSATIPYVMAGEHRTRSQTCHAAFRPDCVVYFAVNFCRSARRNVAHIRAQIEFTRPGRERPPGRAWGRPPG